MGNEDLDRVPGTPQHDPRLLNRVCMIVQSTYPNDERVRREAEALDRERIPVDVICLRAPGQSAYESMGLVEVHRVAEQQNKETLGQYTWLASKFSLAAFFKLQQLAMKWKYGVIQAHNLPDTLIFLAFFQKLGGKRLVLDLHDLSVELLGSKWSGSKSQTLGPILKIIERLSCAISDKVITTSEGFRDRLISRGIMPDKIRVVMNTADPRIFKFDSTRTFKVIERGARLLYHGTVAERFGLVNAIEAIPHLHKKIPESTLSIYGSYDPSYKLVLERRIKDLGMEKYISLGGHHPLEKIYEFIKNSDIGLVPYQNTDFMNLALSTKTFEYAATGLPVVASRLNAPQSVFGLHCVRYVNPGDPADMAAGVAELCLAPETRRINAEAAREALSGISGDVMSERYIKLVSELMPRNGF